MENVISQENSLVLIKYQCNIWKLQKFQQGRFYSNFRRFPQVTKNSTLALVALNMSAIIKNSDP